MRKRVSSVILSDNKLLLIKGSTGFYADFYFTPGGKVEKDESDNDALIRECSEELSTKPLEIKFYTSYETLIQNTNEKQLVNCYLVKLDINNIKLSGEITKSYWYSYDNYKKSSPKIADGIYSNLIPKLKQDNLIK